MSFCTTAIARQETPYLLQWVAYQRVVGATHVMIYDNGHDRAGRNLLLRLHNRGAITCVPWSGTYPHGPQVPAYDDALVRLRGRTEWVLFVDLDEYVVPVDTDRLDDILDAADDLDGIWFPWLIFGSSGQQTYHPDPVIARFRNRQCADDTTITPVKSAVRPERTKAAHLHVHHVIGDAYANPRGERMFLRASDGVSRRSAQYARGMEIARVHHYMTKSEQEWRVKVRRGRADRGRADTSRRRQLAEFSTWDRNEVHDPTAVRFLGPLREEIARLRRLIDQP
jgi:hypothetical protein